MARDPLAVFFQVFMPVAFAALGIWLGTLSTERSVEPKRPLTYGKTDSLLSSIYMTEVIVKMFCFLQICTKN